MLHSERDVDLFRSLMANDTDPRDGELFASLLVHRPAWQADALCAEYPREWWFPARGESLEPAKEVCSRCLVADECYAYARAVTGPLFGVWAGCSAISLRRERRAAA